MDKNYLLETASNIQVVGSKSVDEYIQKSDYLIAQMNLLMVSKPDIDKLVGQNNIEMMKDNHANHVRFMASIFKNFNPEVFVETVLWVFRAYRSHGFTTLYWACQMNTWIQLLKETLTKESFDDIFPYYEWIQKNIPILVKISDQQLDESKSRH
jgi:hypothetical protein